jgi:hypothetical protein
VYQFQSTVAFTGFAGQIHSGDDWYITSHGLAAQETTNEYFGTALAKEFIVPQCVSEFVRVMVANFLAHGGLEWTTLFGTHHSGTYCNQYMVVDFKRYAPGNQGSGLSDDLLWVVEEMPGNVTAADVTQVLRDTSYWASYNIPYFPNIYVNSGFLAQEEAIGDFFSYTRYARPQIFRRNQTMVKDLESMKNLMQYNDWQHDPLSDISNCTGCNPVNNPTLVIAARGDLVPQNAVLPANPTYAGYLAFNADFGAIDSKIASYSMMASGMQSAVFCGPTPQQPLFSWSKYGLPTPPGAVDLYNFTWQTINVLNAPAIPFGSGSSTSHSLVIGLSVGIPCGIIAAALLVRFVANKKQSEDGQYVPLSNV